MRQFREGVRSDDAINRFDRRKPEDRNRGKLAGRGRWANRSSEAVPAVE